jgi:hypothetical protein
LALSPSSLRVGDNLLGDVVIVDTAMVRIVALHALA